MNIKNKLRNAVSAHIAGDSETASSLLKEAITGRARSLVKEQAAPNQYGVVNWWQADIDYFGPYEIEIQAGEVDNLPAGVYDICVDADSRTYGRNRPGTFSSRAETPDEFFGEESEIEITINAVQISPTDDENALVELQGAAAAALVPDSVCSKIEAEMLAKAERAGDDFNEPY